MRLISASVLTLALFCVAAPAMQAGAQDAIPDDQESADDEVPAAAEAITEEREVTSRDALVYNAELLDALLTRSTKQTIREQKFAAAAGITGGMILLGLSAWRLIENDPQSQYSRGLGVMFMTLGMADLTTGVYAATRIPHERRRLERWEKASCKLLARPAKASASWYAGTGSPMHWPGLWCSRSHPFRTA